ncbi:MAG: adenosine deaminase [Verrucomicrobiota bacterium]
MDIRRNLFILSNIIAALLGSQVFGQSFTKRFAEIWNAATEEQRYKILYDLPKGGDIHNHSVGSNICEWMLEISQAPSRLGGDVFWTRIRFKSPRDAIADDAFCHTIRNYTYQQLPPESKAEYVRMDMLTEEEEQIWVDAFRLDAEGEGRFEFFNVIWTRFGDMYTNFDFRLEMFAENVKAFHAEGVIYWEPMFSAHDFYTNEGEPIPLKQSMAMVEERLAQPDIVDTGMVLRFQRAIFRLSPRAEDIARELYAFVDANRDHWVGLNMAGIEEAGVGYPLRFLPVLRELRAEYPDIPMSFHAGEMDGPDTHIRETLLLGANRIGHGLNIKGDPDTLLLLQMSGKILIEINLISNQLLEYIDDIKTHPFPELLRTGVPVCLNTDDRGIWDSNLTDEYYTAMINFNLSWPELTVLGQNSLTYAFVEETVKSQLLEKYEDNVKAFEAKYSEGTIEDALALVDRVDAITYGYAKNKWGIEF